MRVLTLVGLASLVYWVMTHPDEYDKMTADLKSFNDDLYSGKLISDAAEDWKKHVDTVRNKDDKYRFSFEELENMRIGTHLPSLIIDSLIDSHIL